MTLLHKVFAPIFLSLLLLTSCYNSSKNRLHIFRYNEQTGIASLDPAFAKNQSVMWAVHQLYSTLIDIDSNLHLIPSIARQWSISGDRTTYTFSLRTDVFFHDDACFAGKKGRRLTARDVVFSLGRILHGTTVSPGAWIFNGKVAAVEPFTAANDSTFILKLARPYPPILGILSMQYCSIVPEEAVRFYGTDFRRHPVGSGPFQFVAWEEGQALIMKRNSHYFELDDKGNRLPYLDGVTVSFYDSKATEFLLFRQKKLSFINDIDPSFKDEVLTKKGSLRKEWENKILLQTHPYLNIEYFGILYDSTNELVKNSPLKIRKVRQAINYAIDRQKLVLYLRNSLGIAAVSGFVPAGLPSFDSTQVRGYHYDLVKARQLLKEAGLEQGSQIPITLLTIPTYSAIADFVARELEVAGIRIKVEIVQKALLLDMTSNSKALLFRGSWIADYPDAENYLSVFYSKFPAPPNYTRYHNENFDRLFEAASAETNDSLRYRLYRQADQVVINDAPVIPLFYDKVIHLVQKGTIGFEANALNLLELRRTRISE